MCAKTNRAISAVYPSLQFGLTLALAKTSNNLFFWVHLKGHPLSIKKIILRTFVLGAIAVSTTFAAKADTLDFTLTGEGTDITFALPSSPSVSSPSSSGFVIDNVTMDVDGFSVKSDLDFYLSSSKGGFAATWGSYTVLFDLIGSQLFTGSVSDPTFKTGSFTLTPYGDIDSYSYCKGSGGSYTLSIVDPSAVTPEPSSMLLMATGIFALVGAGAVKRFAA